MHYFILSVSKNRAQLFEVSSTGIKPLAVDGLPSGIAEAWQGMERHEQSIQSHSMGNGNAAFHGQGGAKDIQEQEEDQYLHAVAKSLHTLLHNQHAPLVFAGVAEEYGMFKKFDQSGRLIDEYIQGSPDQTSMEDLKAAADPIVKAYQMEQGKALIEEYGNLLGTGRTSNDADAIFDAAENGKVDLLLMAEGQETAMAETVTHVVAHRGRVALVEKGSLPENAEIGAILRY